MTTTTPSPITSGEALKPCPFCGGAANSQEVPFKIVWCTTCHVSMAYAADWNRRTASAASAPVAQSELDALDAKRYRWLRDHSEPGICTFYLSVGKAFHGVKFIPATVDEAIDAQIAAIAAQQPAEGREQSHG